MEVGHSVFLDIQQQILCVLGDGVNAVSDVGLVSSPLKVEYYNFLRMFSNCGEIRELSKKESKCTCLL